MEVESNVSLDKEKLHRERKAARSIRKRKRMLNNLFKVTTYGATIFMLGMSVIGFGCIMNNLVRDLYSLMMAMTVYGFVSTFVAVAAINLEKELFNK